MDHRYPHNRTKMALMHKTADVKDVQNAERAVNYLMVNKIAKDIHGKYVHEQLKDKCNSKYVLNTYSI